MVIKLPLPKFVPHMQMSIVENGPTLNLKNITVLGIEVVGGGYENLEQSNTSSLIISNIWARK